MWCYRRILKISWRDRITNVEVLRRVGETETKIYRNICRRKLKFAGHVIRGSSGEMAKNIIEGTVEGKRSRGRQRKTWIKDIKGWMGEGSYGAVKRRMEDKQGYRSWSSTFSCWIWHHKVSKYCNKIPFFAVHYVSKLHSYFYWKFEVSDRKWIVNQFIAVQIREK